MFTKIPRGTTNWDTPVNNAMTDLQEQITRVQTLVSSASINVLDRGVKGDGTTDDLAALQVVLDEVGAAGGGVVFFPPVRTYCVSDYLQIQSGTVIVAYGATIKGIANRGLAKLYRNSNTTFTGYTGHSRIRIYGGTWDVNAAHEGVGTVTAVVDAFLLGHNSDVTFDGLTIRNVSGAHAIDLCASRDVSIVNCRFEGFKDNTVDQSSSFREAIQLDFAISGSGINGAFDGTPCRNILVENCYFGPSDRLGGFGRAVGSHTSYNATTWAENVQVLGNRIEGMLQEGIRAYAWKNSIIADNIISGTGAPGISVTGPDPATAGYNIACQNISVDNNTVDGPVSGGSSPIRVIGFASARPTGVTITRNTVTSSPSTGIYISQADGPQVADNRVMACVTSSIYAINCATPVITGNPVSGSGGASIGVDACTGGHIAVNNVEGSGGHGILVSGGSNVMVTGNRVSAAVSSGIRATTNTSRARIMGNTVVRGGVTSIGLDITASATDCVIIGNDLTGGDWTAAGATDFRLLGTRQITDWAGGSASPGLNLAN